MADKWKRLEPKTGWTEKEVTAQSCPETPIAP